MHEGEASHAAVHGCQGAVLILAVTPKALACQVIQVEGRKQRFKSQLCQPGSCNQGQAMSAL